MQEQLISHITGTETAPVVVLFGGNPHRRHEVITLLSNYGDITVYGTLSEQEGFTKIEELNRKVDVVLIGGRYSSEQRVRIKNWVAKHMPQAMVTEPGHEYPYSNDHIFNAIRSKVNQR